MAFQAAAFQTVATTFHAVVVAGAAGLPAGTDPAVCIEARRVNGESLANCKTAMEEYYTKATGRPLVTATDRHEYAHWVSDRLNANASVYE